MYLKQPSTVKISFIFCDFISISDGYVGTIYNIGFYCFKNENIYMKNIMDLCVDTCNMFEAHHLMIYFVWETTLDNTIYNIHAVFVITKSIEVFCISYSRLSS